MSSRPHVDARGAKVGSVVERLVASPTKVEDNADLEATCRRRRAGARGANEEEGEVRSQQHRDKEQEPTHEAAKVVPRPMQGKHDGEDRDDDIRNIAYLGRPREGALLRQRLQA